VIKVGITGNMGSGKSLVCSLFEQLNIPVFYADDEAKNLYNEPQVMLRMKKQFGKSIYLSNGKLNKKKLSRLIFTDELSMQFIRDLIYPELHKKFDGWAAEKALQHCKYVLYEAALILENGFQKQFDKLVLVSAPEKLRIERIRERDKLTEKAIRARMNSQWPEEKKLGLVDFVIVNDGNQMLIPQVIAIHKALVFAGGS
jgi:dephospho-CoA kinase